MADNAVGTLFWILAVISVVTAIGTVTIKKVAYALFALTASAVAVGGLLLNLGYFVFALIYLLLMGGVATLFWLRERRQLAAPNEIDQLELQPRTFWIFVISMMIFSGCLYLIAHTDVWQYALTSKTDSFSDVLTGLTGVYLLPLLILAAFLIVLSLIFIAKFRKKDA